MLWKQDTAIITFRIDRVDWKRFLEALKADDSTFSAPSQKVRELVLAYTDQHDPAQRAAAPAPPAPPSATKKAKPPATKKKKATGRAK